MATQPRLRIRRTFAPQKMLPSARSENTARIRYSDAIANALNVANIDATYARPDHGSSAVDGNWYGPREITCPGTPPIATSRHMNVISTRANAMRQLAMFRPQTPLLLIFCN